MSTHPQRSAEGMVHRFEDEIRRPHRDPRDATEVDFDAVNKGLELPQPTREAKASTPTASIENAVIRPIPDPLTEWSFPAGLIPWWDAAMMAGACTALGSSAISIHKAA